MAHTHARGHGADSSTRRLAGVCLINLAGFVAELVGGILFGSVALMGDAIHMLFDGIAYLTAFVAAYAAEQVESGEQWPFGLHRLEVITAVLNGILLIPMAGWIIWEAYTRYLAPVTIDVVPALTVAAAGLAINLGSVYYLNRGDNMGLNERGAYYHLLADTGGSFAVIIGITAISLTGITIIDPLVAVLIGITVIWSAASVLREGVNILLQKSPIPASQLKAVVESIDGVEQAHDIKSWQVCSRMNVCTVHAVMAVTTLAEADTIRHTIDERLKQEFDLQHITLQIEQAEEKPR